MKRLKNFFTQLLCILMTVTLLQPFAASNVWNLSGRYILPNWLNLNPISSIGVVEIFTVSNGSEQYMAWCIEPDTLAVTGAEYEINDNNKNAAVENIILNWHTNYSNNRFYNKTGGYYAVQVAIWGKLKGIDPATLSIAEGADEEVANELRSLASELYNSTFSYNPQPVIKINEQERTSGSTLSLDKIIYLLNGMPYYRLGVEVNRNGLSKDFEATVSLSNMSEYIVRSSKGETITVSNNQFSLGNKNSNTNRAYIYIPITQNPDGASITVDESLEVLTTAIFDGSKSNSQRMQAFWEGTTSKTVSVNLDWEQIGAIGSSNANTSIIKKGESISNYTITDGVYVFETDTLPLSNTFFAVFLTDESFKKIDTFVPIQGYTNEAGELSLNFSVSDQYVYNESGKDYINIKLAEVQSQYGYLINWINQNGNGTAICQNGYCFNEIKVSRKNDNNTFHFSSPKEYVDSLKTFTINVTKTDLENTGIGGTTFGLYTTEAIKVPGMEDVPEGSLVAKGVTDENGRLTFDSSVLHLIANQSYFLKELAPASGYKAEVNNAAIDGVNAEIIDNGVLINFGEFMYNEEASKEVNVTFRNEKLPENYNLTIKKVDGNTADPATPLAGAKISVVNQDNINNIQTGTTDANGSLSFTLEAGTYIVTETEAPEGYSKAPQQIVTLDSDKEITMKDFKYPQESFIIAKRIISVDTNGNPILDGDGNKIDAKGYGSQEFSFGITKTINGNAPQGDGRLITVSDSASPVLLNNKTFNGSFETINVVYDKEWEDNQWKSVTYEIFEYNPADSSFGKDNSTYTVTYTAVKDSEGKITWDVSYGSTNPRNTYGENVFLFENTFRPNPYEFNINITKNVNNEVANGNHSVNFTAINTSTSETKNITIEGSEINEKTGTIKYTIASPGHYSYKVFENFSPDYYVKDTSYYTIDFDLVAKDKNLVVSDDGFTIKHFNSEDVEQSSSSNENTVNIEFTNEYRSSGTLNIPVKKTFEGNDFEKRNFTFKASCGSEIYNLELNEENGYQGNFEIPLKAGNGQTCTVLEFSQYSDYEENKTRYKVSYNATDDGLGTIIATNVKYEKYNEESNEWQAYTEPSIKFENVYKENTTDFTFYIEKQIGELTSTSETFTIKIGENDLVFSGVGNVQNGKSVKPYTFSNLSVGHYEYLIKEDSSNPIPGWKYDENEYTLTFDVNKVDNGTGGWTPMAQNIKVNGNDVDLSNENLIFSNIYKVTPVNKKVTINKSWTDINGNPLSNLDFVTTYSIETESGNPYADVTYEIETSKTGIEGNGEQTINFVFAKAGTYVFNISENDISDPQVKNHVTKDDSVYQLTFNVTDNNSTLTVNPVVKKNGSVYTETNLMFTNKYSWDSLLLNFNIRKNVTNESKQDDVNVEAGFEWSLTRLEDGTNSKGNVTISHFETLNGQEKDFDVIINKAGNYVLTVRETSANYMMSLSSTVYTISFATKLENNAIVLDGPIKISDGREEATYATDRETLVFTNNFKVLPAITVKVSKAANADTGEVFNILCNGDVVASLEANTSKEITLNLKEGLNEFVFEEEQGSATGWTYDGNSYTLKVEVGGRKDSNDWEYQITNVKLGDEPFNNLNDEIGFVNSYKPLPVSIDYTIVKKWNNIENPDVFTSVFQISDVSGNQDSFMFSPIEIIGADKAKQKFTFNDVGTYTFKIREKEVKAEPENETYLKNVVESNNVETLTFNVVDVNGQLTIANAETGRELEFVNDYTITPAQSSITINKVWKTGNVENGKFETSAGEEVENYKSTFSVDPQGTYEGVTIEGTKSVTGARNTDLSFKFLKEGTYVYKVKETSSFSNVESDSKTHTVTFEVYKDGLDGLKANVTVDEQDSNSIAFENHLIYNTYKLPVRIVKEVLNEIEQDGKVSVSFNVLVEQGKDKILNKTYSITNEEGTLNGEFADVEIPFYKEGEYTVTISEKTAPEEMTKDNTAYKFDLTLARDKAVLSADSIKVYKNAKLLDNANVINKNGQYEIKFVNEYPAPYQIVLEKHVTGKDEYTEEFIISNGTNYTLSGFSSGVASKTINLTLKPGTNEFMFSEVDGGLSGWNYDPTVYHVIISATKNEDGSKWKYEPHFYKVIEDDEIEISSKNPLVWNNSYGTKPTEIKINIQKKWEGLNNDEAKYFDSTISVNGEEYTLNGNESLSYSKRITEAGTYTFEIKEESFKSEEKYSGTVNKDSNVYNFTVKVEEKDDALKIVESNIEDVTFKNTYTWNALDIQLPITKTVKNEPTALSQFEILVNEDKIFFKGSGTKNYQIGDLSLGVHTFEIKEQDTKEANYEYDDSSYKVVYTVSKNGLNKVYTYAITKDGENASKVEFINTYNKPSPKPETPSTKPSSNSNPVVNTSVK